MDTPFDPNSAPRRRSPTEWGPVIGIVIIVTLLIAGGIYFLASGQATGGYQAPALGAART